MKPNLLVKPWPFNHIPESRPADWGVGMTVCIASYCSQKKCFAGVTDSMIATSDMSVDAAALKYEAIGHKWIALFSGNDVSDVVPIMTSVRNQVSGEITLSALVGAFQVAFRELSKDKAESQVLSAYDMTMAEFKQRGLTQFGPEMFARLAYQIEDLRPEICFLVYGFGPDEKPHIFTVERRGEVKYFDVIGFWAIGSGQTSALGSLFVASESNVALTHWNIDQVLYRCFKAKFQAETAPGVGAGTLGSVLYSNGERYIIFSRLASKIREAWKANRPPEIHPAIDKVVKEVIAEAESENAKAGYAVSFSKASG